MPSAEVATLAKLRARGWYLSEEGLEICMDELTPSGSGSKRDDAKGPSVDEIIAVAKNIDIKTIGVPFLSDLLKQKATSDKATTTEVVLQVQKIRNISAPKINENSNSAPRMLRLNLSDGYSSIKGVEIELVPGLNLNLPPGTKVHVALCGKDQSRAETPGSFVNNYLLLGPTSITVIGGRVPDLVDKWELMRSVAAQNRVQSMAGDSEGCPPWIPFGSGQKTTPQNANKNFKALPGAKGPGRSDGEGAMGDSSSAVNQDFENHRRTAINEASAKGAKKGTAPHVRQDSDKDRSKDSKEDSKTSKKGSGGGPSAKSETAVNGTNGSKSGETSNHSKTGSLKRNATEVSGESKAPPAPVADRKSTSTPVASSSPTSKSVVLVSLLTVRKVPKHFIFLFL
ncbi:unnamed protein product [Notodromas monacha]|uniref:RecQ mediated genome instability protein 1 OB-fold domain-containing protein n=1 Tax=Notodromas monacha TaxID=399045 RepID=A0A7R9BNP6_9CRUS|nr:unnamed protein product [Notodromas monacha]CAG0918025.1 unnamed protein product [Notodromas monacha]